MNEMNISQEQIENIKTLLEKIAKGLFLNTKIQEKNPNIFSNEMTSISKEADSSFKSLSLIIKKIETENTEEELEGHKTMM